MTKITVADTTSLMGIYTLNDIPDTKSGFMFFQGALREIRDIHETKNGKQIELYPHRVY